MKRFFAAVLTVAIVCAAGAVFVPAAQSLRGDVNDDGAVDFRDYAIVKRIILQTYEPGAEERAAADIDGDGEIGPTDYLMIKRDVLGLLSLNPDTDDVQADIPDAVYGPNGLAYRKMSPSHPWLDDYTYDLIGIGRCRDEDIVIASEIDGYPVTTIRQKVFKDCDWLKSVQIPDSVIKIGESAFQNCTSLEEIRLPDSVETVDCMAFTGCSSLKSVWFGKGVKAVYPLIGFNAVSPLYTSQFDGCVSLKTIEVDSENPVYCVKQNCLIDRVEKWLVAAGYGGSIPSDGSVESIGTVAFRNADWLTELVIPPSVTGIATAAFRDCVNLESVTLPENLEILGKEAFRDCTSLESVSVPGTVKEIGDNAFQGDIALSHVSIGEGVETIRLGAFIDCKALEKIVMPSSVRMIYSVTFKGCDRLEEVVLAHPDSWVAQKSGYYVRFLYWILVLERSQQAVPEDLNDAKKCALAMTTTYADYTFIRHDE